MDPLDMFYFAGLVTYDMWMSSDLIRDAKKSEYLKQFLALHPKYLTNYPGGHFTMPLLQITNRGLVSLPTLADSFIHVRDSEGS